MKLPARSIAALGLVVTVAGGSSGCAQAVPLTVALDECVGESTEAVERIVRLELASSRPPSDASSSRGATVARVGCGEGTIRFTGDDPLTQKHVEREVSRGELPERGRARLVIALPCTHGRRFSKPIKHSCIRSSIHEIVSFH